MSDVNDPVMTQGSTLKETDKKCPQCGGTMDFDPEIGGLACPYCGYAEDIESAGTAEELDFASAEKTENCNWGAEKKTIVCKSCGAETIYDALEVSNECPYCGSNQVMEASDENTLAPGGVIPFSITSEVASENFKKWIGKKFFCPKLAKQSAQADAFTGIYLPYWTFDTQTVSRYTGQYGIDHQEKDKDGQTKTVTDWHRTFGKYSEFIDDELVLGTNRHNTGMLKGIEPFDTAKNIPYKPEYVAGFAAERYSIGIKDAWEKAKASIKQKLQYKVENKIRTENKADRVKDVHLMTVFNKITYKYLMLPVWCSSFQYNGKVYQFMVNGQTGKVYGRTPTSAIKVIITIASIILALILIGMVARFING